MAKKPDCLIVIDFGSLSNRVIASKIENGSKPVAFVMESSIAVAQVDVAREHSKANLKSSNPEDVAWVSRGNDCRALGYLAQTKFTGHVKINEAKYESAIFKTMAILWVVGQKLNLGNKFSVALNVLFPPGEMGDRDTFFDLLRSSCKRFESPTGFTSIDIADGDVEGVPLSKGHPEGTGIAFEVRINNSDKIKSKTIPVVMCGFRNISTITLARGSVNPGSTSSLGMVNLLNRIESGVDSYGEEKLSKAVFDLGDSSDKEPLFKIVRANGRQAQIAEVDKLLDGIKKHRDVYVEQVIDWLNEALPQDYDALVFCGGTADYLKPWLEKKFKGTQILWQGGVKVPEKLSCGIGNRMADAYGLFNYAIKVPVKLLLKNDK